MQIASLDSNVYIPDNFQETLQLVLNKEFSTCKLFITVDENTKIHCLPMIKEFDLLKDAHIIETKSGEENKSPEMLVHIWQKLSENNADRNSVLINLGGGMLCDLGGFAASTFKRGIRFIHIPTTLLSQVDASVGGKLGINFNGLKNEVGLFKSPDVVFISSLFLKTLDNENMLSGFSEMIKHALIYSDSHWNKLKKIDINSNLDFEQMKSLISRSIFIKNEFIKNDPVEKNIRKALNFGHTIGHAFESMLLYQKRPLLHGIAVAHGMICEAYISHKKLGLHTLKLKDIVNFILSIYPKISFEQTDFEQLFELMTHDKKNDANKINFTLLPAIGEVAVNVVCSREIVYEALNYYLEL